MAFERYVGGDPRTGLQGQRQVWNGNQWVNVQSGPGAPSTRSGGGGFGGGFGTGVTNQLLGLVDQMGGAERMRIEQDFEATQGNIAAGLQSRGLLSTGLLENLQLGAAESREQALLDLMDNLLGRKFEAVQFGADVGSRRAGLANERFGIEQRSAIDAAGIAADANARQMAAHAQLGPLAPIFSSLENLGAGSIGGFGPDRLAPTGFFTRLGR